MKARYRTIYIVVAQFNDDIENIAAYSTEKSAEEACEELQRKRRDESAIDYYVENLILHYKA